MATDKCLIDACDRGVECPQSGLCKRCYSSLYYWRKKSVTEIVKRKGRLKLFMSRMQELEPKVEVLPRRRKG